MIIPLRPYHPEPQVPTSRDSQLESFESFGFQSVTCVGVPVLLLDDTGLKSGAFQATVAFCPTCFGLTLAVSGIKAGRKFSVFFMSEVNFIPLLVQYLS